MYLYPQNNVPVARVKHRASIPFEPGSTQWPTMMVH